MINKPWYRITKEDIERLVEEGVPESHTLDYKQELPNDSPQSKVDFLSDVAAFANASGGDLIFGVREMREEGKPTAIPEGFTKLRPRGTWDEMKRGLDSMIRTGIEPTLSVRIVQVDDLPEGPVIVIRVPASWVAPHMVTKYGRDALKPQFYRRHNGGNHSMDIDEIRAAFTLSGSRVERLRRFREERVSLITSQHDSVPALKGAEERYILHLLPFAAFEPTATVDISRLAGRKWGPSTAFPSSRWRGSSFNFDGYLIRDFYQRDETMTSYVQIYRSGAIEAAKVLGYGSYIGNDFEWIIIRRVAEYLEIQRELDAQTPVLIMPTLWGLKGKPLIPPPNKPDPLNYFDRDILPLPESVVNDFDAPLAEALRPSFDALYQSAGGPRSPNYDREGKWIGQPYL
jgi:Putative DNA-binding domain